MGKTENGCKNVKREFHGRGRSSLNAVSGLVSTADGCKAQNKNYLIWQVEEDGSLGQVEEDGNLGQVEEDDNLGKVEKDDNLGKVEEDGNLGKVEENDNLGKMEEDGSLGKDKMKVCKVEMMAKHWKNAYYYLLYHETAQLVECLEHAGH